MQRRAHQERTSRELTQGRIARYLVIVSILSSGSLAGRAWAAPSLPEADPAGPAQTDAVWAEPAPRAEQSSLQPAASPDTAEADTPAEVAAPALDWSTSDWALSMLSADLGMAGGAAVLGLVGLGLGPVSCAIDPGWFCDSQGAALGVLLGGALGVTLGSYAYGRYSERNDGRIWATGLGVLSGALALGLSTWAVDSVAPDFSPTYFAVGLFVMPALGATLGYYASSHPQQARQALLPGSLLRFSPEQGLTVGMPLVMVQPQEKGFGGTISLLGGSY